MDLHGVQEVLDNATGSVSTTEVDSNINSEKHGDSEDLWTTLPIALDNCQLDTPQ